MLFIIMFSVVVLYYHLLNIKLHVMCVCCPNDDLHEYTLKNKILLPDLWSRTTTRAPLTLSPNQTLETQQRKTSPLNNNQAVLIYMESLTGSC